MTHRGIYGGFRPPSPCQGGERSVIAAPIEAGRRSFMRCTLIVAEVRHEASHAEVAGEADLDQIVGARRTVGRLVLRRSEIPRRPPGPAVFPPPTVPPDRRELPPPSPAPGAGWSTTNPRHCPYLAHAAQSPTGSRCEHAWRVRRHHSAAGPLPTRLAGPARSHPAPSLAAGSD